MRVVRERICVGMCAVGVPVHLGKYKYVCTRLCAHRYSIYWCLHLPGRAIRVPWTVGTSPHGTSPYGILPYGIYRMVSYRIVSYRMVFYRIVSYRRVSYRMVSYRMVSYRTLSYRMVSYRRYLTVRHLTVPYLSGRYPTACLPSSTVEKKRSGHNQPSWKRSRRILFEETMSRHL